MSGRRLRIHGRVQGVFFRNWVRERALELGLSGWVRNRRDGSVELLAFGDDESLDALAAACRTGPPAARVERVDVEPADDEAAPPGFRVAATE